MPHRHQRLLGRRGRSLWTLIALSIGLTGCSTLASGGVSSTLPAGSRVMPSASSSAYVIGTEDVIQVSVWKHDALSQEQTVRTDGRIALKLVGEVPAAGMTLQTLRQLLTEKYRDFVPEAEVSVSLKEMNSFRVYVLGRVSKPGEFRVQSQLTVLQALALAGGFTPYADERKVRIVRRVGGQDVLVPFNFQAVMRGQAGDLPLEPGDRILVP